MTITPEQSRMARGALEWSMRDLAKAARISPTTVNQFERGYAATNNSTLAAIRRAFEDAGIVFIDNGEGPGVRLVRPTKG
jgi:transcriptional regulator with XRE-family HTH domain